MENDDGIGASHTLFEKLQETGKFKAGAADLPREVSAQSRS